MASVFITKNAEETIELGKETLLKTLKETNKKQPLVFYLSGELGAGKTYFVKGIAAALGISGITSPTFVLMKKFKLAASPRGGEAALRGKKYFFHIDCYRIYDAEDARQIGLDKAITNPRAIVAIEWAERIAEIIPKPYWKAKFKYRSEGDRSVAIQYVF